MNFNNYCFHDSIIEGVCYDGENVNLSIAEGQYEGALGGCTVILNGENIEMYYFKQRPRRKIPTFKGRMINIQELTRLFKKGLSILVEAFWKDIETNTYVLSGVLFPFARGAGVYRRIYILFDNEPKIVL